MLNSGHKINARPNGGVAFVARLDLKLDFCPISNRFATLTLQLGVVRLALIGCHAPAECPGDNGNSENCYRRLAKIYINLSSQCQHIIILGDLDCRIRMDAKNRKTTNESLH